MIKQIRADYQPATPIMSTEDQYQEINSQLTELWRKHGQHAWLYHLNAAFGYEFMILREKRLIRF